MDKIPWQRWVKVCVVLVLLGLAADYYFLHILFNQKAAVMEKPIESPSQSPSDQTPAGEPGDAPPVQQESAALEGQQIPAGGDNFLVALKACRPDISAQGVATPEALLTYLEKSIGQESGQQGGNSFAPIADGKENINKSVLTLKDASILTLDDRGGRVLAFELNTDGKKLFCRGTSCSCR